MLFPEKDYKKYEKSWNQWLTQHTENIRNKSILASLEQRLDFDSSLWKIPEIEQREIIPKIAQKFVEKYKKREDDFILLKPIENDITKEQQRVIERIKENIQDSSEINRLVQNSLQLFTKKAENQYFLLEILQILYENSFYTLLNRYIFPSFLPHHKDNFYIKMKEVNSLINIDGSSYEEIYSLLDCIKPKSKNQETDILTMKISTFRKFKLKENNITKDILFDVLSDSIKYYNHIYKKDLYYYPAINLAYMLKLYSEIIPDSQKFKKYDIEKIYLSVQESIKKDKKGSNEDKFYATMSDLEFCLLLEKRETIKRIEESLEELNPSKFLAERPLFQMIWFVNLLEEFSEKPNNKLIELCYSAMDIFERHIYLI